MNITINNFVVGVIVGAIAALVIVALFKQISDGHLLELRRDNSGNIVEILEHGI